ncbi:hypothetical protein LXL04_009509 [Taraxacum kok-saghyz]
MEHYKSRNNDFFHFTNPHDDDASEVDDYDDDDYDELQYDDVDDDRSCDFNFHNFRPIGSTPFLPPNSQTSGVMNQNDTVTASMEKLVTFDHRPLISHLDNTMKNLSDKLQHTIEGISTRISNLEDETCKLDKHVEIFKNLAEKHHGTTHIKLRQMQNVLQEVQDDVLFLKDKHEIAETKLQLAKLQSSKKNKVPNVHKPLSQPPSNEPSFSQKFPHFTQSYQINPFQGSCSPQNHPFLNHNPQQPPYTSSSVQQSWGPTQEHEESMSHFRSSRNYKSEFHAKYMPEFSTFSNKELPFPGNYTYTPVTQPQPQPLPHALPTAVDLEDGLSTEGNSDTVTVDDIVDRVTLMGFRKDIVKASVRKLKENGSLVDMNAVLDKMMNNK